MAALKDFIQKNFTDQVSGKVGGIFAASAIVEIATADNKLKQFFKTLKDIVLFRATFAAFGASLFGSMGKSIKSIIADTGSLQAALSKLRKIQGLQDTFKPLVGGADAAKKAVAGLVNLAASKNLRFEEIGEAARSLQIMTRGAFAGVGALSQINDIAKGTGNSIGTITDAVGGFSAALRSGGGIDSSVESLRQLGVVTGPAADELLKLKENGASAGQIFSKFKDDIEDFKGSADEATGSLDEVNKAYELASANLQEKFASPFVDSDVENTKNMTAAMNGIAPVVERLAGMFHSLFGGFETAQSQVAKWIAQSGAAKTVVEGLVVAFTALVAVVSLVSAASLATWLIASAGAAAELAVKIITATRATGLLATAITALGAAGELALLATGIGVVIAVLTTAAGIYMQVTSAAENHRKEMENLTNAYRQSDAAMRNQISLIGTLAQKHDAVAKALTDVAAAQDEVNKAMNDPNVKQDRFQAMLDNLNNKKSIAAAASSANPSSRTEEEVSAMQAAVSRDRRLQEEQRQFEYDNSPTGKKIAMELEQAGNLGSRASRANAGLAARAGYSRDIGNADISVEAAERSAKIADDNYRAYLGRSGAGVNPAFGQDARDTRAAADRARAAREALSMNAPKDSSVYAEGMARRTTGVDRSNWEYYAEQRRQEEGNAGGLAGGAQAAANNAKSLTREYQITQEREKAERKIAQLKQEGFNRAEREAAIRLDEINKEVELENRKGPDANPSTLNALAVQKAEIVTARIKSRREQALSVIGENDQLSRQQAQLSGNHAAMVQLDDKSEFVRKFNEFFSVSGNKQDAANRARQFVDNSISLSSREAFSRASSAAASSSLAKIAGGGNVADVSNDMLDVARRQEKILEESKELLKTIADAEGGAILQ